MFEKVIFSKIAWLTAYVIFAFIAWNFEIKGPMRLAAFFGLFGIGAALNEFSNSDVNKYKWVSIHLFGMLLAVYTADIKLW